MRVLSGPGHLARGDRVSHRGAPAIGQSRSRGAAGRKLTAAAGGGGGGRTAQEAPPVRAVLFDMDGVLCNSEELSQNVAVEALRAVYGLEVKQSDFRAFTGMGEANFLGGVARLYRKEDVDVALLKSKFFELYLARADQPGTSIGYPGARDLVLACRGAGLRTAVASSADRIKVDTNLRIAGFEAEQDFDAIVSADLFERLKPAPDIFLTAAKELGVEPEACVVIEDALAGVEAARAAGMRVVGVTTSLSADTFREKLQEPDALRAATAEVTLEDLRSLQYTGRESGPAPVQVS